MSKKRKKQKPIRKMVSQARKLSVPTFTKDGYLTKATVKRLKKAESLLVRAREMRYETKHDR